ncbi:MAG: oligosaccharide flippase family protein [bacterium]
MTSPAAVPPALPGGLRRNSLANVASRTLSAMAWVAVTPWVLQVMGPERFGVWALFFALAGSAAAMDLGVMPTVTRFVALAATRGESAGLHGVLRRATLAALALGAGWVLVAWAGGAWFVGAFRVPEDMRLETLAALTWFGWSLAALTFGQVWQGALHGVQRLDLANLAWIVGLVAHLAVLGVGLASGHGLLAAAWGSLVGHLLMAIVSWAACLRHLPRRDEGRDTGSWRDFGGYGGAVQLSNLLVIAQMQGGRVLLGLLGGLSAVTVFELAFRVANTLWSPAVLMQGALVPAAASASADGAVGPLADLLRWGLRWMCMLGSFAMGGVWVAGGPFLRLWLGPDAAIDRTTLPLLALAFAVATPALAVSALARGAGRPGLEGAFFGLAAVVQVVAACLVVPQAGATGAALALVVSFALSAAVLLVRAARWLEVPLVATLARHALPHMLPAALAALAVLLGARVWAVADPWAAFLVPVAAYLVLWSLLALLPGDTQVLWRRARAWAGGGAA